MNNRFLNSHRKCKKILCTRNFSNGFYSVYGFRRFTAQISSLSMGKRTINNTEMKTEIDISCREQSSFAFFNTQDHTAVVIIIASFNINRTVSFVYTLLCSSRKSNYSQHLFSSSITIYKNLAGTLLYDSFVCLNFLLFVRVT
jgi:hypothetical protein